MSNNYFDNNQRVRVRNGGNDYLSEPSRRPSQSSGRGSGSGNGRGNGRKRSRARKAPLPMLIFIDILAAALVLLIFYVTNYELAGQTKPQPLSTPTPTKVVVAPSATNSEASANPTESGSEVTTSPTVDPNDWRAKFSDKFTDGEPVITENSYKSANINITIEKVMKGDVPFFIADIYVADVQYFKTAFAKQADVLGERELTSTIMEENNGILAINGDHCLDNKGLIIRNGNYYPAEARDFDILVMYRDGTMKTLSPQEFDVDQIKSESPYQVWSFGPMLLKDGQALTDFNLPADIGGSNPRTAVGYYEPGHYCFVVIGGRQGDYSLGCTMQELAQLFADRGCTVAYNLDGGKSSEMIFNGVMLNEQGGGRRSTPDILYIGE